MLLEAEQFPVLRVNFVQQPATQQDLSSTNKKINSAHDLNEPGGKSCATKGILMISFL
jgi:hypothetical protein